MTGKPWHITREDGGLVLSRQIPPRFDVAVSVVFPLAAPLRLAQQIRQDMWRAVQNVRGFSPVVKVETRGDSLLVTAGGRVAGRVPGNLASEIRAILEDESKRSRWLRHALRDKKRSQDVQSGVILHKSTTGFDKEVETGQ
ncbi:MAG: hypothetical protein BM560_08535 [Roseobacter sp. MedPE-SWde]|uniref:hypothetical protein n=1 Tax=Roseobacter sp. MED193 TaxID=314262 RepID=UPI000068BA46|nr:hypothetical protein [Roseobacter sp. MED193]EAQ43520.1 hypothetical protein MED193_21721 [Roseobacter sp. MED193]OIQ42449.1 MAG: hypothetical protein BM560_08535 [Roseobacter sp. MedPE-SWde]